MKNLATLVVNWLKKALAWCASKRDSADVKNSQDFNQPENKAVTANENSLLDIKLRQVATGIKALMDEQRCTKIHTSR